MRRFESAVFPPDGGLLERHIAIVMPVDQEQVWERECAAPRGYEFIERKPVMIQLCMS
jgi:hypothetical protein